MEENWQRVHTTVVPHEAYLIQGKLEAEGIQSVVMNTRDQSYTTFGEVHIYVDRENVLKAIQLIQKGQQE